MRKSLIIIPTYNEVENIQQLIKAVFDISNKYHILVIDDNSPDGTAENVEQLMLTFPGKLHLIKRKGKLGLGTAYIKGFYWAIENNFDYVFEMDADFSHDPADLPRLLEACEKGGADLAIGSRYVSGVNVVNWPLGRILMSYFASAYVRFITGMDIKDTTAGFKCYNIEVLKSLDLEKITFKGYAFQIEMKFAIWKLGYNIVEVPIIFTERRQGISKMSGGIFNEALWGVIILKLKSLLRNNYSTRIAG
ncbi:MAG: polyprenol monophosphomannose synthase [Bacteroidales bacterium]